MGFQNPTQMEAGFESNWVEWLLRDRTEKWWVRVPYHPMNRKMTDSYNAVVDYGFDPEWEYIISAMAHTLHTKATVGHGKTSQTELLGPFRLMELSKQAHMDVRHKQVVVHGGGNLDKGKPGAGDRAGVNSKGSLMRVMTAAEAKS